jgi:hypothetical protein
LWPAALLRLQVVQHAPVGHPHGARVVGRIERGDNPAVACQVFQENVLGQCLQPSAG